MGGDLEALPPAAAAAAGVPSSLSSAFDTIKATATDAAAADSPIVHTPSDYAPETWATPVGGKGSLLPTFEFALQSKLLVGPNTYDMRELSK